MVSRVNNSVSLEEREFRFVWMAWEQNTCRMKGWNVGWEGERFRCNTTRYYKIERKLDNLIKYKYLDSVFFVFFEIFSFEEKSILYITPLQIHTYTYIHASKHHLFLKLLRRSCRYKFLVFLNCERPLCPLSFFSLRTWPLTRFRYNGEQSGNGTYTRRTSAN